MKPARPSPAVLPSADLHLEPPAATDDGRVELACRLAEAGGRVRRLWFRFPADWAPQLTRHADPFVRATLVHAMGRFSAVRVHGTVSAGLAANLADFQKAFAVFQHLPPAPPVEVLAEHAGASHSARDSAGLTAFSGGVDSCFSVFRHTMLSPAAPKRPLRAALLMHGFDIPLRDTAAFARSAAHCSELAREAGLELITGSTNLREFPEPWERTFATAVAASLSFFEPAFPFGLVPSFHDYAHTDLGHGSNPLTDPMLSSLSFQVVHDGAGFGRIDKLRALAGWPAALRHLRVCWQGEQLDRNCCRCEKCIRTILMLRLCGIDRCTAFPLPVGPAEIRRMTIRNQSGFDELSYLLAEARRAGLDEPWMPALAGAIRRNRWRRDLREAARSLRPGRLRGFLRAAAQHAGRGPSAAAANPAGAK